MKQRAFFLFKLLIFWMIYFALSRLFFMLYQFEQTASINFSEFIHVIIKGSWMDLSMTGYILLLSSLVIAVLTFSSNNLVKSVFKDITIVLLSFFSIIIVSDFELYRNWLFRIDATSLLYLDKPKEAMASLEIWSILLLIALIVAYVFGFYWLYTKLTRNTIQKIERAQWWVIPCFVVIAGFMVLPIRGGLGIAPMNPGKVYFSHNVFCNHSALNAPWNMLYSCSKSGDINRRYPDVVSAEVASNQFPQLLYSNPDSTQYLLKTQRPNVVIILLESFTAKAIESQGGFAGVTPNLDRISSQGINFTNAYSAADRSDKGIVSVLAGFPAQPINSVIKYPSKSSKLPSISKSLANEGYSTTFYYGGDPTFASISSFLYAQKFTRIVSQDQFPKEFRNSKWGVHDEYVFDYLLNEIDTAKGPFFKLFFTLTSHEPFEIPNQPVGYLNQPEEKLFLNSIHYTDSCLGNFFAEAQTRDWYANTLFVLVADHGHRYPNNDGNYTPQKFRIPIVWVGGALNCEPFKMNKVCSQFDIATTLLSQLNIDVSEFKFSKNLMNSTTSDFAYYVFNNGYGFITPTDTLVHDQTSGSNILSTSDSLLTKAGSFFRIYQDYFQGL